MHETPATRRWRKLVNAHATSGLTLRAFAEAHQINAGTLSWWRSRIRKLDREASADLAPFTSLTVVRPAGHLRLALHDHKAHLVVDADTDLELLKRVLESVA